MNTVSRPASFSTPDELHTGLCRAPSATHPDDPGSPADDYADWDQSERARVILHHVPRQYVAPEPQQIEVVINKLGSNQFRAKLRRADGVYIKCGTHGSLEAAWRIAGLLADAMIAGAA